MKTGKTLAMILLAGLVYGMPQAFAQTAEELLPKAIHLEEVKGELEEAIKTYQKIISQYPDNGKVCAEALLHMGNCYEKLGKTEAIKSYELILKRYSDQEEQVKAARARLAKLIQKEPEGFTIKKLDPRIPEADALSPDGKMIAGLRFTKGQNIVISYLDQEKIDFITDYEWKVGSHYAYYPVWSPDGKEIAYAAFYFGVEPTGDNSIRVSDLNGHSRSIISNNKLNWYAPNDWMPDGSCILAFQGDTANNQQLGLVPAEGGAFKMLAKIHGPVQDAGSKPAEASFSPDGKFVVYTDILPGEKSDLFVVRTDGKSTWPLSKHPAEDKCPRWSPDGKHIIFLSNRHGSWALWGVAVEEGNVAGDPFLIREGMGNSYLGNWTVHGLLASNMVRIRDIHLLDVNPETGEPEGRPVQLNYLPTGDNSRLVFAPSGKRLAFIRRDNDFGKAYLVVLQEEEDVLEVEIPDKNNVWTIRWKPDGSGIGIHCGSGGFNHAIHTYYFKTNEWVTFPMPFPAWTFDYSRNGVTYYFGRVGISAYGAGIFEYNPENGDQRYVYRPEHNEIITFRELKCSKDYTRLAFLATDTTLFAVNLKSGESHAVADFRGYPSWSRDGGKIMSFGARNADEQRKTMAVFSESGTSVEYFDLNRDLPEKCDIYMHDWSADGSKVAFIVIQEKKEDVLYKNIIPEKVKQAK